MNTLGITHRQEELLGILQEECAEVIQVISKIRRFGIQSFHPDDPKQTRNRELLAQEIGDIYGMVEMLIDEVVNGQEPILTREDLKVFADLKKRKVVKFLRNS